MVTCYSVLAMGGRSSWWVWPSEQWLLYLPGPAVWVCFVGACKHVGGCEAFVASVPSSGRLEFGRGRSVPRALTGEAGSWVTLAQGRVASHYYT